MGKLSGHGYTEGGLSLIPLSVTSSSNSKDLVYKQTHGPFNYDRPNKVLLLLGDDVDFKTSLKDAFVNYIYQTQIKDTYRFTLIDENVTENDPRIRAYIFYETRENVLPYNLVLMDVPPLGGLHSAESDVRTLQNLERFLQEEFKTSAVGAVALVAPSSPVFFRPFINTYNLLNLSFDKLDHLAQILVTNSPTHMPFISSLKKVKIAYNNLFTFYTENPTTDDDEQFLSQIYFHYDYPGVEDFFQELKSVPPSNMSLIKKVEAGLVIPSDIARLRVINQFSETRGHRFGLSFRQICLKTNFHDEANGFKILTLGKSSDERPNKIIMLVGDNLTGKTTMATAIASRLFGVKCQDCFRMLLDDELVNRFGKKEDIQESISSTAYVFNSIPGLRTDFNLVLIDFVGFGKTEERPSNKALVVRLAKLVKRLYGSRGESLILYMAPEMCNTLPESFKALHKPLLALVQNELKNIVFVDAYAPTQKSPVPKALKKLEATQIKVFRCDKSKLSKAKGQEVISDSNWVIENCTMGKLFRWLQL